MQAPTMSAPAQAHASINALAPYKIRKAPTQLYFGGCQPQTYRLVTDKLDDFLSHDVFTYQREDLERFVSWFDPPSRCIFEVYYKKSNGKIKDRGFLCLLCGEFSFNTSYAFKEGLTKCLAIHISAKHHFLDEYRPLMFSESEDITNLLYCDFRQWRDPPQGGDYTDFEIFREYIKNTTSCYLCALCGARYAVAPSFDVIVSHIKRCEYVKDCANNNDLNRYKPPKRTKRVKI